MNYTGYQITEDGQVISVQSNWRGYGHRPLKQFANSNGYLRVHMTIDGKRLNKFVHKLVAEKYLPPRPSCKHCLRHLDGNKSNNHADNLAWGTAKDNANDRDRHGKTVRGEHCHVTHLSPQDIRDIRDKSESGVSGVDLAKIYNVTPTSICSILKRRAWNHV